MPTQSEDHDAPELFAQGVLPARRAIIHHAAQRALLALTEDLLSPGVLRSVNYHLVRFIASIEDSIEGHTVEHLVTMARKYNLDGSTDDKVHAAIMAYAAARQKYEAER